MKYVKTVISSIVCRPKANKFKKILTSLKNQLKTTNIYTNWKKVNRDKQNQEYK